MRITYPMLLAGSLLVTSAALGSTRAPSKVTKKKAVQRFITCPITHDKVLKSKAIKVTAANGKSTYVCCSDCVAAAKKLLMAKK